MRKHKNAKHKNAKRAKEREPLKQKAKREPSNPHSAYGQEIWQDIWKRAQLSKEQQLREPWNPDSGHMPGRWQCRPASLNDPDIEVRTVWKEKEARALALNDLSARLDGVRAAWHWLVQTRTRGQKHQRLPNKITWRYDRMFEQAIAVMTSVEQGAAVRVVIAVGFKPQDVPLCDAEHLVELYVQMMQTRDEFKDKGRSAEDVAYVQKKMDKYLPILKHHCLLGKVKSIAKDMRKKETIAQPSKPTTATAEASPQPFEILLDLDESPDVVFSGRDRAGSSRGTRRPKKRNHDLGDSEDTVLKVMRANEATQVRDASLHTQGRVLSCLDRFSDDSQETNRELKRVQRQKDRAKKARVAEIMTIPESAEVEEDLVDSAHAAGQASQSQQCFKRVPPPTNVRK